MASTGRRARGGKSRPRASRDRGRGATRGASRSVSRSVASGSDQDVAHTVTNRVISGRVTKITAPVRTAAIPQQVVPRTKDPVAAMLQRADAIQVDTAKYPKKSIEFSAATDPLWGFLTPEWCAPFKRRSWQYTTLWMFMCTEKAWALGLRRNWSKVLQRTKIDQQRSICDGFVLKEEYEGMKWDAESTYFLHQRLTCEQLLISQ